MKADFHVKLGQTLAREFTSNNKTQYTQSTTIGDIAYLYLILLPCVSCDV
jgi:hypothetical protein